MEQGLAEAQQDQNQDRDNDVFEFHGRPPFEGGSQYIVPIKGACLSISRGRDRGRFPRKVGGADAVGSRPNEEATKSAGSQLERRERGGPQGEAQGAPSTTPHEGKSARVRRVGKDLCSCATVGPWQATGSVRWGVCGVARLARGNHHGGGPRSEELP